MIRRRVVAALIAFLVALSMAAPLVLQATGKGRSSGTVHVKAYTKKDGTHVEAHDRKAPKSHAATRPRTPKPAKPTKESTARTSDRSIARDAHGRIQRSDAARHAFARQTGYPNGRPGWIIDHVVPLACGGADAPSNMQWQTVEAAKAKDKTERVGCR